MTAQYTTAKNRVLSDLDSKYSLSTSVVSQCEHTLTVKNLKLVRFSFFTFFREVSFARLTQAAFIESII